MSSDTVWPFGDRQLAPFPQVLCTLNLKTKRYCSCNSIENSFLLHVFTISITCILHTLKQVEKFSLHNLKMSISCKMKKWDHISSTLLYLHGQSSVYIHNLLHRNYYICYCFCAGIVQLQLIPQAHYIHHVTFDNKKSHAIPTVFIYIEHSCKWNEISDR
jgi:hypothetical protein